MRYLYFEKLDKMEFSFKAWRDDHFGYSYRHFHIAICLFKLYILITIGNESLKEPGSS